PGSLAGVLVVFDRQGTQICAVEAEVASKNEVSVQRRSETQSQDELRRAKQAALLVDMTQRLAHALRAAARPGTDSSPAL
ncbi:MAG: hypothetical protein KC431_03425, partial [Myxococcales bacterium]|nr:hypothetical protein [Myxococcales bacterium]